MYIPRAWTKATGSAKHPQSGEMPVTAWGFGEDAATARTEAASRLKRLIERITRGEPFPDRYTYGAGRPPREEILRVIGDAQPPAAVITRNAYGAQVLNTARVLFLDIDVPAPTLFDKLLQMIGRKGGPQVVLDGLREKLRATGGAFRIYQTARGYRVMAIDREYDPAGADTQQLMAATGTDPNFIKLCRAQKSFRARLTPKPWRCGVRGKPPEYPREVPSADVAFRQWLEEYERAGRGFGTCWFVEGVGSGSPRSFARDVVDLHDRATRAGEKLPLA
jgi:hypothetical protein